MKFLNEIYRSYLPCKSKNLVVKSDGMVAHRRDYDAWGGW